MKTIIKVFLSWLALQSYALAYAQPRASTPQLLRGAVTNLAQLSLDITAASKGAESDVAKRATQLKMDISFLMRKSLEASYIRFNQNYSSYGYDLVLKGRPVVYMIDLNSNYRNLVKNSHDLDSQNWISLEMLISADQKNTDDLLQFKNSLPVLTTLYDRDRYMLNETAHARMDVANKIGRETEANVRCITSYSVLMDKMGLKVVRDSANNPQWSTQEFTATYRVSNVYDLAGENNLVKRLTLISRLEKLLNAYPEYGHSCIPEEHVRFWYSNLRLLQGMN